jgi:hypothetical protein
MRTTPDVSLVADPATGAWIADTYNLDPSNPFQVVGGTSLSAPAWAGLLALVNQGRVAAGVSALNSLTPTDTQQALYMLPQSDYNSIASGTNGYSAEAGYNLVTGLGTPMANHLVPDLMAYQGSGTVYSGPTAGALQDANLVNTGSSSSSTIDVFSVFDALPATGSGLGFAQHAGQSGKKTAPDRTTATSSAGGSSATIKLVPAAQALPQATGGASLGITPLGDTTGSGTLVTPPRLVPVFHRSPARFATSPTYRSPQRSLVTTAVTAGSPPDGISTLDFESSAGEDIFSLFRRTSRSHRT